MARRKSSSGSNTVFLLAIGVIGGLFLGHTCQGKPEIDIGSTGEKLSTDISVKRLVTEEEIAQHKACLKITETQKEFEACINKSNDS